MINPVKIGPGNKKEEIKSTKCHIRNGIRTSFSSVQFSHSVELLETVSDFIFWGSKITADGDCSHEIKRCLLLGRKVMTNLYSIFKSRGITLPTKVHLVKAMVFPVVMYGCESWIVKVPWTARRSNQSILKEINPGCSLEGLMLKLKL